MKRSRSRRDARGPRDNEFLADRAASWFTDHSLEQIRERISALPEDKYWEVFGHVIKLNTMVNMVMGAKACAEHGWFVDLHHPGASIGSVGEMISGDRVEGGKRAL